MFVFRKTALPKNSIKLKLFIPFSTVDFDVIATPTSS